MEITPEMEAIIEERRAQMEAFHEQKRLEHIEMANRVMTEYNLPTVIVLKERLEEEHRGMKASIPPGTPMSGYQCKWCHSSRFALRWNDKTLRSMASREACFQCNHWLELLEPHPTMARVIVDGKHYMYDTKMPFVENPVGFMGHGGTIFRIKFTLTGDEVKCNNLWTQGEIPEHFRKALPDNAVFITEA
jgi:hypothetical protein